ncbi:thioredoxin family protein [Halioxenophilus aromaticivorans]|uniref:Thioredoxin domain-containing protein n=1 Tax=Halioxenophilus aromaticivorans TaxID=1306992 RepID=A0AAV3U4Y8_9ALTE
MNTLRRSLILLFALLPLSTAWAADMKKEAISHAEMASHKEPFTQARFEQLQQAGEVILIDIYASWCPTCAKQQAVLETYKKANPDKTFYTLVVDYDKQKPVVSALRAPRQSTLLLYKGSQQHWYSVAETRAEVITEQLDKTIAYDYPAKN